VIKEDGAEAERRRGGAHGEVGDEKRGGFRTGGAEDAVGKTG